MYLVNVLYYCPCRSACRAGHKKGRSSAAKWHEALFVIITQKKMKANFFIPVALLSGSHYNSA